MNKLIGYVIAIIGLVGLLLTFEKFKTLLKIPLPSGITNNILTIISLVIIAVGIFFVIKFNNDNKVSEVPIYHGKDVVGFRRLGKK